ncbi:MAG: hypothetical protein WBF03_20080 [Xanthobacteraceae bacterium]|jgi:hypothetical protein
MPAIDAIIISAICVAFIGFALVLAWADYQSRQISQRVEKRGLDRERTIVRQAEARTARVASGSSARETVAD